MKPDDESSKKTITTVSNTNKKNKTNDIQIDKKTVQVEQKKKKECC